MYIYNFSLSLYIYI
jgi:hypothetical protein